MPKECVDTVVYSTVQLHAGRAEVRVLVHFRYRPLVAMSELPRCRSS